MERLPVEYRPEALADLETIFLYVLEISQNFTTASSFTDRIFERCERIGDALGVEFPVPILAEISVSFLSKSAPRSSIGS